MAEAIQLFESGSFAKACSLLQSNETQSSLDRQRLASKAVVAAKANPACLKDASSTKQLSTYLSTTLTTLLEETSDDLTKLVKVISNFISLATKAGHYNEAITQCRAIVNVWNEGQDQENRRADIPFKLLAQTSNHLLQLLPYSTSTASWLGMTTASSALFKVHLSSPSSETVAAIHKAASLIKVAFGQLHKRFQSITDKLPWVGLLLNAAMQYSMMQLPADVAPAWAETVTFVRSVLKLAQGNLSNESIALSLRSSFRQLQAHGKIHYDAALYEQLLAEACLWHLQLEDDGTVAKLGQQVSSLEGRLLLYLGTARLRLTSDSAQELADCLETIEGTCLTSNPSIRDQLCAYADQLLRTKESEALLQHRTLFQLLTIKLLDEHDGDLSWLPAVQWGVLAIHAQWLEESSDGAKSKVSSAQREVLESRAKDLVAVATRHFNAGLHTAGSNDRVMLHVLEIAAYNLAIAAAGCSGAEAVAVALAGVAVLTSTVRGDDELATFPTRLQLLLKVTSKRTSQLSLRICQQLLKKLLPACLNTPTSNALLEHYAGVLSFVVVVHGQCAWHEQWMLNLSVTLDADGLNTISTALCSGAAAIGDVKRKKAVLATLAAFESEAGDPSSTAGLYKRLQHVSYQLDCEPDAPALLVGMQSLQKQVAEAEADQPLLGLAWQVVTTRCQLAAGAWVDVLPQVNQLVEASSILQEVDEADRAMWIVQQLESLAVTLELHERHDLASIILQALVAVMTHMSQGMEADHYRGRAGRSFLQLGSLDEAKQLLAENEISSTPDSLSALEYHTARSAQARLDTQVDAAYVRTKLGALREIADEQDKASIDHACATVEACMKQPHRAALSARKALGRRTEHASAQASTQLRLAEQLLSSLEQMAELSHTLGLYKDACLYLEKAIRYSSHAQLPIRELRLELSLADLHLQAHREDEAATTLASVDAKLAMVQQNTSELLAALLQAYRLQLGARLDRRLSDDASALAQLEKAFLLLSGVKSSNTLLLNNRCGIAGELAILLALTTPSTFLARMPEFAALLSQSAAVDALLQGQLGRALLLSQSKPELADNDVASLTGLFAAASIGEDCATSDEFDEASLKKLKVVDLKELLKERSLPVTGRKQDLIDRILELQTDSNQSSIARTEPSTFDPPLTFLQSALDRGSQLLSSQEQRLLHLSLSRSLQQTDPSRAVYHHALSQGIATRIEAAGLRNTEEVGVTFEEYQRGIQQLPEQVAFCMLSIGSQDLGSTESQALISFSIRNHATTVLKACSLPASQLATSMAKLRSRNTATIKLPVVTDTDKVEWWRQRRAIDAELKDFLGECQTRCLGAWAGLTLGQVVSGPAAEAIDEAVETVKEAAASHAPALGLNKTLALHRLLDGLAELKIMQTPASRRDVGDAICWVFNSQPGMVLDMLQDDVMDAVDQLVAAWQQIPVGPATHCIPAGVGSPVEDVNVSLDTEQEVQVAISATPRRPRQQSFARTPAAPQSAFKRRAGRPVPMAATPLFAASRAESSKALPRLRRHSLVLILDNDLVGLPWESMPLLRTHSVSRLPSLDFAFGKAIVERNFSDAYYVLNPSKDLTGTQSRFEATFAARPGWDGVVGRPAEAEEYLHALENKQLVVYCGHGTGQKYIRGKEICEAKAHAIVLLMGCSSGLLKPLGSYQPLGMALKYLLAGCPAIVANLWDVTDRDIDRFTQDIIQGTGQEPIQLAQVVARARSACQLGFLNGAAPVVYGVPVFVQPH